MVAKISTIKRKLRTGEKMGFSERARAVAQGLVKSKAKNIDQIIEELKTTKVSERSGRAMDHEQEDIFEKLRSTGYM